MRRRRSVPHTFAENIAAEKAKLEAQIAQLNPGPEMDALHRKMRQLDTASHMDDWLSSPAISRRSEPEAGSTHHLHIGPGDVSERGSVILLEMADEDEAIKVAQKSLKTPGAAQQAEMRDWLRLRDRFPRTKIQLRQQALPKILEA